MITLILFILGLIVGSFLNVAGLRFHSGVGLGGRSFCTACRKQLSWWELLPVVSFIFLRGRCSSCQTRISWQYPLIEFLTGLVFATLFGVYGFTIYYLLSTFIFCIYIVILIYDARHKIIPNALVYSAIVLAFLFRLVSGGFAERDIFVSLGLLAFFALLWLFSRGRAMGFGDAKLALSIGLFLGAAEGLSAVVLAFWLGTVAVLGALFIGQKKLTMKTEIPFAPFLVLGAWLSLIFHLDLLHVAFL